MKKDSVYIEQIHEAIAKIHNFVGTMSKEDFLKDQKTQSAIIMQLALIGELSKKISEDTKKSIDLPWRDIVGFRDRAIHDYYQIDLEIVWNNIKSYLALLEERLK